MLCDLELRARIASGLPGCSRFNCEQEPRHHTLVVRCSPLQRNLKSVRQTARTQPLEGPAQDFVGSQDSIYLVGAQPSKSHHDSCAGPAHVRGYGVSAFQGQSRETHRLLLDSVPVTQRDAEDPGHIARHFAALLRSMDDRIA